LNADPWYGLYGTAALAIIRRSNKKFFRNNAEIPRMNHHGQGRGALRAPVPQVSAFAELKSCRPRIFAIKEKS
jgi:hypothetical protein